MQHFVKYCISGCWLRGARHAQASPSTTLSPSTSTRATTGTPSTTPKTMHEHKGHYGKPKHAKGHYGHAKPAKHEHKGHYGVFRPA